MARGEAMRPCAEKMLLEIGETLIFSAGAVDWPFRP